MVMALTPKQVRNGIPPSPGPNTSTAKPSAPVTVPKPTSGLARPA